MKILIVSGIWPPDIGGPASHGPELGAWLLGRGHRVRAITSCAAGGPEPAPFDLRATNRDRSRLMRIPGGARDVIGAARGADVIYATGMYTRAAVAAATWGRPLVLKLVNDPAYERARSLGRFSGTLEEFQEFGGDPVVDALKLMRDHTVARAGRVVIPSRYLARIAAGWGIAPERVRVVPNPAPHVAAGVDRAALRRRFGFGRPTFVFAGRVVAQKNVPLAVTAIRHVPEASLVVIGDGPEEAAVASAIALHGLGDQVVRKSALDRAAAIEWVRAADAAVLPSDWENFPHAAVEALAVGTPVVATSVGGVPEIVSSGVNGLLVPPGDERALAEAMGSVAHDPRLVARLRVGARASADRYRPELAFEAIERALGESL